MKWISVKEKLPTTPGIIVAIMNGRSLYTGDPIKNAEICLLRYPGFGDQLRSMDFDEIYYLINPDYDDPFKTVSYWISYKDFIFPKSMILEETTEKENPQILE